MQTISRSALFVFLAGVLCLTSTGQTIHSFMRPVGSLDDRRKGTFTSVEAGFSIDLPRQIGGFSGVDGIQYQWRLNEGYFVAGIVDRDHPIEGTEEFEKETLKLIQQTVNGFARDYFQAPARVKAKATERTDTEFRGHRAIQLRVTFPASVCIVRVFWIEGRGFLTGVLLTDPQSRFEATAIKVFDTFAPADPRARDVLVRRLIDENTPEALPQVPAIRRKRSDAEDNNLKGSVKSVSQEREHLRVGSTRSPREKDFDEYFDEGGNLIKRIEYSHTNGLPREITVYGYVAGHRVSRNRFITFESSPGGILIEESPVLAKRRDRRYDTRYGHKYAPGGDLLEYTVFDNSGRIWTRTVCRYLLSKKDCSLYDQQGKVSRRWSDQTDKGGNTIVSIHPNSPDKDWTSKYVFNYEEFDEAGNWTRRTVSLIRGFSGIESEQWATVEYRRITYY